MSDSDLGNEDEAVMEMMERRKDFERPKLKNSFTLSLQDFIKSIIIQNLLH